MKMVISLFALSLLAGSASATVLLPSSAAMAEPLDGYHSRVVSTVYSSMTGPFAAFAAATGPIGNDDYTSTEAAPFNVAQFKFAGGVQQAGGGITVAFFDTANNPINSFHVNLPQAGNFLWTITLGSPPDGGDSTFNVNETGFCQITVDAANTGQWFLTTTPATVGSNSFTVGSGSTLTPARIQAFELVKVPAPASLALLGIGGLIAGRRRR